MTAFELGRFLVVGGFACFAFGWLGYLKGYSDGEREGILEGRAQVFREQAQARPRHTFFDQDLIDERDA